MCERLEEVTEHLVSLAGRSNEEHIWAENRFLSWLSIWPDFYLLSRVQQVKSKLLAQSRQDMPPGLRRCWGVDLDLSDIACRLDKLSRLASTLSPVTPSPKPSLTTLTCKDLANTNALLPSTLEVVLEVHGACMWFSFVPTGCAILTLNWIMVGTSCTLV